MDPTNLTEAELSERSGISRGDLKRLRERLKPGADFIFVPGKPLLYTPAGRERILFIIAPENSPGKKGGGGAAAVESREEEETKAGEALGAAVVAPAKPPEYIELLVDGEQLHCRNPRLVVCTMGTEDGRVRVKLRVKDNHHFAPGMKVPQCVHASDVFYDYHGKLPRRKGKL